VPTADRHAIVLVSLGEPLASCILFYLVCAIIATYSSRHHHVVTQRSFPLRNTPHGVVTSLLNGHMRVVSRSC
jgi:hypothetical protein